MNVRDATIIGFFTVFLIGRTGVIRQLIEPVPIVLGFFGFASLIIGRTFIRGPHGGLLRGIGIGLFIETFIQNYF